MPATCEEAQWGAECGVGALTSFILSIIFSLRSDYALALSRKNALFAGCDGSVEHWAVIASLIETAKLNGVEPHACLADIMARIVSGHPNNRIDELLPWAYPAHAPLRDVA
ncbi:hypothetical protein CHELA40_10755 [Chelatococcus asaccharovorans]|nr:hypothetical protein CHELA40_10755 [Chelatococcus asaccharovorans]CAH1686125.1 hypothetical protein CHELA17_64850 [Chelatococcus asaccharovorans]